MTTALNQPIAPLPIATDKQTKAGNYFVANYPPFSFWSSERRNEHHESLQQDGDPSGPLGLYVHIPYCRKRCHFCYFKVYTDANAKQIEAYTAALASELQLYAKAPFIGNRHLQFVYFGGGTPSYLSVSQLNGLFEQLQQILSWNNATEVTFECEPGTLTQNKLHALKKLGVTRLSLGIENFNDHVLKANNRAHLSKQVLAAYDWSRNAGFAQINIDLIAGMLEETQENWIDNVHKTIDLAPDCVTIYQMEIPYNTTIYQEMANQNKLQAPVADWDTKRRWVKYAFECLEQAGYTVTSAYTAVKDAATSFIYRDRLWQGADLIGLGVASFGHINRTHYQNHKDIDPYIEMLQNNELPVYRALATTDEEAMIRELVLQLKLGRINVDYFRAKFRVDILERFASQVSKYQKAGFIERNNDHLLLTRDALLQVDIMLHEFFLPQHQSSRYT